MVRWPASCRRLNPFEAHLRQIERVDKHVDHPNRITLVNEIIEAFGQQRRLPTISLFNEAPHRFPPQESRENHNSTTAFSHSQGHWRTSASATAPGYCGTPSTAKARNVAYLSPIFRCAICVGSARQAWICSRLSQTCTVTRLGASPSNPVILPAAFPPAPPIATKRPPAALMMA